MGWESQGSVAVLLEIGYEGSGNGKSWKLGLGCHSGETAFLDGNDMTISIREGGNLWAWKRMNGGVCAGISVNSCLPTQVWAPHSSAECVGTAAVGSTTASTPAMAAVASSRGV